MSDAFENHCWQDVVPAEDIDTYRIFRREVFVGPAPALVAIDLYEMVYEGGARPIREIKQQYPYSCGEYAWAAIPPTQRLFAAARAAGIPIVYTTVETRADTKPADVAATHSNGVQFTDGPFAIRPEFAPQPGDLMVRKARASAFYGTPLQAHLTQLGVRSIIMLGESTSGCLRASAVDAYSNGFHVTIAEECCYDRSLIAHKINLFDLHHKYCDVMHVDEIVAALEKSALVGAR
jgi:nicotinamidase-related amidase